MNNMFLCYIEDLEYFKDIVKHIKTNFICFDDIYVCDHDWETKLLEIVFSNKSQFAKAVKIVKGSYPCKVYIPAFSNDKNIEFNVYQCVFSIAHNDFRLDDSNKKLIGGYKTLEHISLVDLKNSIRKEKINELFNFPRT